ncbi:formylglycine-generating enzyme family protein [Vibrio neptunius]|uniref:SUMF1/EgtB/PvdO family nonheme iron enzyme n=1 Tax=Vibrio neptunius TaxID=170651 RepID=A0ABS3A6M5_9VIBR|nr:SUMF1/EgtB/PvdO family nonheme iron enzyme [Vibrio neptunius]MBN3494866.1 SUMF1/EgtB/PvdO family nonheme iron enzyme [Vibrio neptunius]MBN3517234.1 SUMF1/EgtB/PvdO family nonheme iron enzyme [Vibrio neptunius]MBN3551761.1 SUMF1/EgtB/PvdO family nonheme iron enzyme [Vibrio neptunius]MBN3579645.1 SUMF1/EgtB/PvdO family nonheme iron enzyme [Vibrio neptunius]MCH9873310.1 SUMF1/EgtB/PvdO family nonheme iron enzyme [Vibrio neptunius]
MKNRGLALGCMLPLLAACNTNSSVIHVTSDTVSQQQLDTIVNNIEQHYPDATNVQRQRAADVVVRAIETLIFVEGGSFDMGDFGAPCLIPSGTVNRIDWSPGVECLSSPASTETGAHQLHKVTLDSYSISKFETRFIDMEWTRLISGLPVAEDYTRDRSHVERDSERYELLMSDRKNRAAPAKKWQEAKDYCQWLGSMSGLPFDLPTEAQWEYAARSKGQNYYYATNNGYIQVYGYHYRDPKTGEYREDTKEEANAPKNIEDVDTFPPNPLGVYGMSNQVSEWVNDWYSPDYYINSPEHNPQGPETGTEKVLRDGAGTTMTFSRLHDVPEKEGYFPSVSFRCALQQPSPAQ